MSAVNIARTWVASLLGLISRGRCSVDAAMPSVIPTVDEIDDFAASEAPARASLKRRRRKHHGPNSRNRRARRARWELDDIVSRIYLDANLGQVLEFVRREIVRLPYDHRDSLRRLMRGGVNHRPDSLGHLMMMRERYHRGLQGYIDAKRMWMETLVAWVLLRRGYDDCTQWEILVDCVVRSDMAVKAAWDLIRRSESCRKVGGPFSTYCEGRLGPSLQHVQAVEVARSHCRMPGWMLSSFECFIRHLIDGECADEALKHASRAEAILRAPRLASA